MIYNENREEKFTKDFSKALSENKKEEINEEGFIYFDEISNSLNNNYSLTEEEFLEEYSDVDDLDIALENAFSELDETGFIEYSMNYSYLVEATPQQPQSKTSLGGIAGNILNGAKQKVNDFQKQQKKSNPIATNIFTRIFNVIKNAFGVVAAFMEKAYTTFKINNLRNKVAAMPSTVRYETLKGFLDNTVDSLLDKMVNGMNTATNFLKNITIVGRMVPQKQCEKHFEGFQKIIHGLDSEISKIITADKQSMLKQVDSLQRQFQKYSKIKVIQKSFLTVMNACSDPVKLANMADKLMKTAKGEGMTGFAGVGLDMANMALKGKSLMQLPGVSFIINTMCKIIGAGLAKWKKTIYSNLSTLQQAFTLAVSNPKNSEAIRQHNKAVQKGRA